MGPSRDAKACLLRGSRVSVREQRGLEGAVAGDKLSTPSHRPGVHRGALLLRVSLGWRKWPGHQV